MDSGKKLYDYTPEEQNDRTILTYPQLCALRRQAWAEHVDSMDDESYAKLTELREIKTTQYGPAAKAIHNVVPWDIAFMVSRYGEEVKAHETNIGWPTTLTEADLTRLAQWKVKGAEKFPGGYRPIGATIEHDPTKEHLFGLKDFAEHVKITIVTEEV